MILRVFRLALLLLTVWSGASHADAQSAGPGDQKSVLVLLPGQPGLPASTATAAGIRAPLVSARSVGITIETEHVDVARFKDTDHEARLRDLYRSKYVGQRFDAIVVAATEPLGFVLRWRDDLWPRTPVIVCAVDERTLGGFTPPPWMTLITVRYDLEGTLRAALALLPETRHVALVGGASPVDRGFNDLGRGAVKALGGRPDLIDLTGLSIEDLLSRVSALPKRTIVLGSAFQVDGAGRRFYGVDIVGPISAASNSPLFSVFGTVLGEGIVGGSLVDFEAVGREAGESALRLLAGERMPSAPIRSAASNVLEFDWRQLRRWGLSEARLPAGSRVLYRQPTVWEQYHWEIVGTGVLIAAQAALIIGLLAERRRRRTAQDRLTERLRFEALVADISASFASVSPARVDDHIHECLGQIGSFLGMDRGSLWQLSDDGQTLSTTHLWTAFVPQAPPAVVPVHALPFVWELANRGQSLSVSSLDELPAEASGERRLFAGLGMKSLALVPLRIGERTLGLLGFASLRGIRPWPPEMVTQLKTLGDVFGNALMRRQAATALQASEALTSAVLTALPAEIAILAKDGKILLVNEAWNDFAADSGSAAALSVGAQYLDACRRGVATSVETAGKALDLVESVLDGGRSGGTIEYASIRGHEERWFELRVEPLGDPGQGAAIMRFDITARKHDQAEARRHLDEIAHVNRVAALGELAASLAHELNQPLTAILTNAQAAQRLLSGNSPDLEEFRECLADIVTSDRRAGEVIRGMRGLLKKGTFEPVPIDLGQIGQSVVNLVSSDALLLQVSVEVATPPALLVVEGDVVQIQQVALNLLLNAISAAALAPVGQRKVTVRVAAAESYAEMSVHDSGPGIAEHDLDRVFEPFFTTKHDGLGMGLTISRSIIQAHGGKIWAENEPPGGATFRMRLPTKGERLL